MVVKITYTSFWHRIVPLKIAQYALRSQRPIWQFLAVGLVTGINARILPSIYLLDLLAIYYKYQSNRILH